MDEFLLTTLVIHQNFDKLMFIGMFMLEALSIFNTTPASISELSDLREKRQFCILFSPYHNPIEMLTSVPTCRDARCNGTPFLPAARIVHSALVYRQTQCAV